MAPQRRQPGKRKSPEAPAAKRAPRKERTKKPLEESESQGSGESASEPALEPEVLAAEPEVLPPDPEENEDDGARAETTLPVPVERDLSRADALQRYMAEVARHPLLSREEELRLATEFQKTQDPRIAYRLVTANLRLVVKIAHEYRRAAFSLLDLVQEGNVGLMHAVRKYDPGRGVKLSSYAAWWIRAYILRYLMDNWRMVKLGTTQAQRKLFFNLRKEQEKLLAQGFDAAPKLLAERLDVSEQDVQEMDQRLSNDEFSLDTPVSGGEDARQTYADRLAEGSKPAEEALADEELRRIFKEKLAEFGKTLTDPKEIYLFEHRLGVSDGEPKTLQEVGNKFGFTRERARQLEARLTDRLRDHLRKELPDFAQLSVNPPEEEQARSVASRRGRRPEHTEEERASPATGAGRRPEHTDDERARSVANRGGRTPEDE
ncbi:MAG: RNA polymerase sigma factor RpoD/SigA [Myxococcales bacterium]